MTKGGTEDVLADAERVKIEWIIGMMVQLEIDDSQRDGRSTALASILKGDPLLSVLKVADESKKLYEKMFKHIDHKHIRGLFEQARSMGFVQGVAAHRAATEGNAR